MINIVLNGAQLLVQCIIVMYLSEIRMYLKGIDAGQEEMNEYLSDIRKMHKEAMSVETDETCCSLEKLSDFMERK